MWATQFFDTKTADPSTKLLDFSQTFTEVRVWRLSIYIISTKTFYKSDFYILPFHHLLRPQHPIRQPAPAAKVLRCLLDKPLCPKRHGLVRARDFLVRV